MFIINFISDNIVTILIIIIACFLLWFSRRYARFLYLSRYCRKLAKLYNSKVHKNHPLILRVFGCFKTPDITIWFDDKTLNVKFFRIKKGTVIRFVDDNTIEKMRCRKAMVPYNRSKGLAPSFVASYGSSIEINSKSSKMKIQFAHSEDSIDLILFTEDTAQIRVFNDTKKNDDVIGNGEQAFGYYVGDRSFLKKWIERNN